MYFAQPVQHVIVIHCRCQVDRAVQRALQVEVERMGKALVFQRVHHLRQGPLSQVPCIIKYFQTSFSIQVFKPSSIPKPSLIPMGESARPWTAMIPRLCRQFSQHFWVVYKILLLTFWQCKSVDARYVATYSYPVVKTVAIHRGHDELVVGEQQCSWLDMARIDTNCVSPFYGPNRYQVEVCLKLVCMWP